MLCYRGGGNIGFMFLIFILGFGLVFEKVWYGINVYLVIRGVVRLNNVGFFYFGI